MSIIHPFTSELPCIPEILAWDAADRAPFASPSRGYFFYAAGVAFCPGHTIEKILRNHIRLLSELSPYTSFYELYFYFSTKVWTVSVYVLMLRFREKIHLGIRKSPGPVGKVFRSKILSVATWATISQEENHETYDIVVLLFL